MKRRKNAVIWIGFLIVAATAVAYVPAVQRFPQLQDAAWPTLALFVTGAALMAWGVARAFRQPQIFRGRILGTILLVLGLAFTGLFAFSIFVVARQLPASEQAPRAGMPAPDFTLKDARGAAVSLADLLDPAKPGQGGGAVIIFYRGYW